MDIRTLELAGILMEADLEKAKSHGAAMKKDVSMVIVLQENMRRIELATKKIKETIDQGPVDWPKGSTVLPPDLLKKLKKIQDVEEDAREISEYLKTYWKASIANK